MKQVKMKRKKMYATAIDASKAFDKVNRQLLWLMLFKKVGFKLTMILRAYYSISKAYVTHMNEKSSIFCTTIGVKQGGPLSPRLFAIYIEDIENVIDSTGIGIKIGAIFVNLLMYADDIILISETKVDMQVLIDLTEKFGIAREIKFNPEKTNFISVNDKSIIRIKKYLDDISTIRMDNEIIAEVNELKYLGSYISNNLLNKYHLNERLRMTAVAVDTLVNSAGLYNDFQSVKVKVQLYKTYVRLVLLYGLETMVLGEGQMKSVKKKTLSRNA